MKNKGHIRDFLRQARQVPQRMAEKLSKLCFVGRRWHRIFTVLRKDFCCSTDLAIKTIVCFCTFFISCGLRYLRFRRALSSCYNLCSLLLLLRDKQGKHKVFPWLQNFIGQKLLKLNLCLLSFIANNAVRFNKTTFEFLCAQLARWMWRQYEYSSSRKVFLNSTHRIFYPSRHSFNTSLI